MAEKEKIGRYAIFPKRGVPRVLGGITEKKAIEDALKENEKHPGTILLEIIEGRGGVPVDFLPGECLSD